MQPVPETRCISRASTDFAHSLHFIINIQYFHENRKIKVKKKKIEKEKKQKKETNYDHISIEQIAENKPSIDELNVSFF